MAIRQNKTVKPPEKETQTEDTQEEAVEPTAETKEPTPDTKEVATKEPAGAIAVVTEEMPSIISLRDKLPGQTLGFMAKDNRIVGSNGALVLNKTVKLGEFADIQVLSTSFRWMVGPKTEKPSTESNKLFRASYDGKTIPGFKDEAEMSIEEWIAEINEAGYEETQKTKYLDVFCTIFNTEKKGLGIKDDDVFQIQVSTTAIQTFDAFTMTTPLKVSRGSMILTHQNCMRVTAKAITGDFNYTVFEFDTVPIDIVQTYVPVLI